jgi:hypothetical protein
MTVPSDLGSASGRLFFGRCLTSHLFARGLQ